MSMGISIKGFDTSVNGTYTLLSSDVIGTLRVWDSDDEKNLLKYRELDPEYRVTLDVTFDPSKTYYVLNSNGQYVIDQEHHDRADEIPSNVYYEKFNIGRWEIVPKEADASDMYAYKYIAVLDDITIDPYHPGVIWEDRDGNEVKTGSIDYWNEVSTNDYNGLISQKEGFGARALVYQTWELKV